MIAGEGMETLTLININVDRCSWVNIEWNEWMSEWVNESEWVSENERKCKGQGVDIVSNGKQ